MTEPLNATELAVAHAVWFAIGGPDGQDWLDAQRLARGALEAIEDQGFVVMSRSALDELERQTDPDYEPPYPSTRRGVRHVVYGTVMVLPDGTETPCTLPGIVGDDGWRGRCIGCNGALVSDVPDVTHLLNLLAECRDWFDNPDGEPSSSELLDRINEALR